MIFENKYTSNVKSVITIDKNPLIITRLDTGKVYILTQPFINEEGIDFSILTKEIQDSNCLLQTLNFNNTLVIEIEKEQEVEQLTIVAENNKYQVFTLWRNNHIN